MKFISANKEENKESTASVKSPIEKEEVFF